MKEICIKENIVDFHALEKFSKEVLSKPPLNFKFANIEDEYFENCLFIDFDFIDGEYVFNMDKYNKRNQFVVNQQRIDEINKRLTSLTQDFIQVQLGAIFEDLEERKEEFKTIHNELRELQNKKKRLYM